MSEEERSTSTRRRRIKKLNGEASPSLTGASEKVISSKDRRTNSGLQQYFVDVLGWGIFTAWAIGFSVDMINLFPNWDLPPGIWGLMTIVSGAAFVAQAMKKDS